jgi:hypothetical protein
VSRTFVVEVVVDVVSVVVELVVVSAVVVVVEDNSEGKVVVVTSAVVATVDMNCDVVEDETSLSVDVVVTESQFLVSVHGPNSPS